MEEKGIETSLEQETLKEDQNKKKFDKKDFYLNCIAFVTILFVIILVVLININNSYKQGIKCFNEKNWSCVIEKLEKLYYKDSQDKLKIAKYENYIQNANYNLDNKKHKKALLYYKKALELDSYNGDLKIKIESLELIVKEQQKREEIKKRKQAEERLKKQIKAKISDSAIYPIPTRYGEGYDNTINRYGIATINRINKLAPKAAELVAQNPNCTRVMAVDVADDRSTRNSITFFVDCGDVNHISNIQRFYVNEKDINTKIVPKSIREQAEAIGNGEYMLMCEAEIKARLNFPSTFKSSVISNNVYKSPINTVVTIPFKAKNAFNLELKHKGICYYNGITLVDININEQ